MVQYKKEDIKEKIDKAALKIFAEKGYEAAKISDISKEAGVSVGNIYKYYKGKDDIFYEVVPGTFIQELKESIKKKIIHWKESGETGEKKIFMNENLAKLLTENRERIIIAFRGSKSTEHEGLKEELIEFLTTVVLSNYKVKDTQRVDMAKNEVLIKIIFENLVNMIGSILYKSKEPGELFEFLKHINRYHMFGITGIIENLD